MSFKVLDDCIGCGACEFSCPTSALSKTDSFLGTFVIDPFLCNDCEECVDKCPVQVIVADPEWPVCSGRGCPLTSKRMADVDCAFWQDRCPDCGSTLWRHEGDAWSCPQCGMGAKVRCPKTHHLEPHLDRVALIPRPAG